MVGHNRNSSSGSYCNISNGSGGGQGVLFDNRPTGDQHLKIKLNGGLRKRLLFNYIIGKIDSDYPFVPEACRKQHHPGYNCPKCEGAFWRWPILSGPELRRLASQINMSELLPGHLKLRIPHFERADKCATSGTVAAV